jgi:hypothetical protein
MGRPGRPLVACRRCRAGSADPVRRGCHRKHSNRLCGKMRREGQDNVNGTDFGQIPHATGVSAVHRFKSVMPGDCSGVPIFVAIRASPAIFICSPGGLFTRKSESSGRYWQIGTRFAPTALLEIDGLTGHQSRWQIDGGRRPPDGQLSRAPNAATSAYLRA